MKNNLFFVANDYNNAKFVASSVAEFFDMRLFDSVEMFEFDHTPRKIEDVLNDFGYEYVNKKMKSIVKMQLDFDDSVFVGDLTFLEGWRCLFDDIKSKNLVIFLNDKTKSNITTQAKQKKIEFLGSCCDLAIEISGLKLKDAVEKIVTEIKSFFNYEV